MPSDSEGLRELEILEALSENPEARQVDLAVQLGVAVGTINWLVKRLAAKGFLKVKRIGRWQWRYLLTAKGITQKARLMQQYVRLSMNLYRLTRESARRLLRQVKQAGSLSVRLDGTPESDLVDVCRLTCLEEGIEIVEARDGKGDRELPLLRVVNREVELVWPKEGDGSSQ